MSNAFFPHENFESEEMIRMQSRCIEINKIYILNPTAVAELLQYSGFRVEHGDGFSS